MGSALALELYQFFREVGLLKSNVFLKVIMGLLVLSVAGVVNAQQQTPPILYQPDPDSPIGERNDKAPEQWSDFDFVIGDWDADITWQSPDGQVVNYMAHWHNTWVVNGLVVMQEWRGPFLTGAELRTYEPEVGKWTGQNVYPGRPNPWHKTTAEFKDGRMVVIIENAQDQSGTFHIRETYFEIEADKFRMKSEKSYDQGVTWETGSYEMICTRRKP